MLSVMYGVLGDTNDIRRRGLRAGVTPLTKFSI